MMIGVSEWHVCDHHFPSLSLSLSSMPLGFITLSVSLFLPYLKAFSSALCALPLRLSGGDECLLSHEYALLGERD